MSSTIWFAPWKPGPADRPGAAAGGPALVSVTEFTAYRPWTAPGVTLAGLALRRSWDGLEGAVELWLWAASDVTPPPLGLGLRLARRPGLGGVRGPPRPRADHARVPEPVLAALDQLAGRPLRARRHPAGRPVPAHRGITLARTGGGGRPRARGGRPGPPARPTPDAGRLLGGAAPWAHARAAPNGVRRAPLVGAARGGGARVARRRAGLGLRGRVGRILHPGDVLDDPDDLARVA